MYRKVTEEEFFKKIGSLDVTLEVKEPRNPCTGLLSYPYTTLFLLKNGKRLIGFENQEGYFLRKKDTDHE